MVYETTDGRLKIKVYLNAILYAPCGIRGSNYRGIGVRGDVQLLYERRS